MNKKLSPEQVKQKLKLAISHVTESKDEFVLSAKESYGIITKTALPGSKEFDMPVNITLTRRQTKATFDYIEQSQIKCMI